MQPFADIAAKLARAISDATEALFEPGGVEPVGGGCIHTALAIEGEMAGESHRYFAKVNDADRAPMFAAEAEGLEALRAGNPTGRALPLLRALAAPGAKKILLDYLSGSTLTVEVEVL